MSVTSTEVEVRIGYDIAEDSIKEIMANDSSSEIFLESALGGVRSFNKFFLLKDTQQLKRINLQILRILINKDPITI